MIVIAMIVLAVGVAAALTVFALQQNMTYLYSPSEVDAGRAPVATPFRLGGVVKEGSIHRVAGTLTTDFTVTDRFHDMRVQYTGILPDLFREGQSVIATGRMRDGGFAASEVLAKHDETYMPKEVADAIAKAKAAHRAGAGGEELGAGAQKPHASAQHAPVPSPQSPIPLHP